MSTYLIRYSHTLSPMAQHLVSSILNNCPFETQLRAACRKPTITKHTGRSAPRRDQHEGQRWTVQMKPSPVSFTVVC